MRSKHYGGVWGVGYGVENGDVEVGPPPNSSWYMALTLGTMRDAGEVRDRMWWTAEHQGHEGRRCLREFGQLSTYQ